MIYMLTSLEQAHLTEKKHTSSDFINYIKRYPKDFIVEEVLEDGFICTIENEKVIKKDINNFKKNLHFTIVKENRNTLDIVKEISSKLNISESRISFSGLKDNKAITSQRFCIEDQNEIIEKKIRNLILENAFIKEISYSNRVLSRGSNFGNKFTIFVRKFINGNREAIDTSLKIFENNINLYGMPNFFGEQRFGRRKNFKIIGKLLLQKRFDEAITNFILYTSENESFRTTEMRKNIQKNWGNWSVCLNIVQKDQRMSWEKEILKELIGSKEPEEIVNKLSSIFNFAVEAYQSSLFNILLEKLLMNNKLRNEILPVIGYDTRSEIYDDILESEGITKNDFKVNEIIGARGGKRNAILYPLDFSYEIMFNGIEVSFILTKGSYASVLLDYLLSSTDVIKC